MTKLGDIPVPVEFTRDQVRLIRGMIATTAIGGNLIPAFQELKDILDAAEDHATVMNASGWVRQPSWRPKPKS